MNKPSGHGKRVILFIDTGDNCRCPMAAGYFLKLLEQRGFKHIEIRTAGVMTPTGLLPTPEAVHLLQEEGVDIRRHRSRPLGGDMIKKADLVLGMTPFHVQTAFRLTEEARGKTFLLKEYVGRDGKNTQIADPMGGTLEIFKKCFNEIRASLQRLVEMDIVKQVPQIVSPERVVREQPAPVPPAVPVVVPPAPAPVPVQEKKPAKVAVPAPEPKKATKPAPVPAKAKPKVAVKEKTPKAKAVPKKAAAKPKAVEKKKVAKAKPAPKAKAKAPAKAKVTVKAKAKAAPAKTAGKGRPAKTSTSRKGHK